MQCPECGTRLELEAKLCPNCNRLIEPHIRQTSVESQHTDVLKPRSSVSIKGTGSRMAGSYHVAATRHRIADSYESESSQKYRCAQCGFVNEKSHIYCEKCGSRNTQ